MKKILVLLSVFMPIALLASTFSGKLEGTNAFTSVNIQKLNNEGSFDFVTTVVISPEGLFTFSDNVKQAEVYTLAFAAPGGQTPVHQLVMLPNENVSVVFGVENNSIVMKNVGGSENMKLIQEYQSGYNKLSAFAVEMEKKFTEAETPAAQQAIQQEFYSAVTTYQAQTKALLSANAHLLASALIGYTEYSTSAAEAKSGVLKKIYDKQKTLNPGNFIVKEIGKLVENLIEVGKKAPEIELPGLDGKNIKLSSLKDKVVLIDFWASWCRPCRMENPNVVKAYNMFKDKGFTVYSVSLDANASSWQNAIEADGLVWPYHVSSLKQWNCPVAKQYNVRGIPYSVLIDKDGKILALSLRGEELIQKLAEVLK